ncbi:MAG: Eco57I restriction-modification methylase domain-containing protein, partial [Candidatus Pacebacteria bacterium]|nr:Eco57I restriction-modification methylase domain-containing protein [Candidatus Paceibacterota bacterium]
MDFSQPYKQKEFLSFLSNFLPDDFEQTEEQINLSDLSFKPDKIKRIKMMGTVPSLDNLQVYEIKHHSEFDPRVTLSRETFRLMSNYNVRKILAVFVSENSPNYRFSLATVDLKLKDTRVTKEYSNPRRYSFFLGPDAKIHTPTKYLSQKVKDYKELQERFSIEVVTKEFFSELSNWYFWALKNIECPKDAEKEKNGKNIWTIRLITRLIFIWFMKQKGLVPDYLFDENELSKFLNDLSPKENTYYKAILQNLFFATLNTPQSERRFRSENRYYRGWNPDFKKQSVYRYQVYFNEPEKIMDYFKEIPFLNGGLFECLDKKDEGISIDGFSDVKKNQPIIPNFLFFSEEHAEDLNEDYGTKNKKYKVRGIIKLLQTYNFTIDESTPIDVEIALDPELLGRVFENLLASYNPETATTARKATGSYYTPREIVDYMVTQSIKEHFKTKLSDIENIDDKLDNLLSYDSEENPFNDKETDILINSVNNLRIIDPAVGSGAFAMGILQKLVLVLSKLDPHNEKWKNQQIKSIEENITDVILKKELIEKTEDNFKKNELDYGRKLYLIQNCIYGIDIQPIAIQIARLRFFISLLVDEKRDREQDENYGIDPLPNLELKFISANSLIGLKLKGQSNLKALRLPKLEEDLKRVRELYFRTSDMKQKEKLREKDKEIRNKISDILKQSGFPSEDSQKIADWEPYNSNKSADWFDPEWMFGIKHPSPSGEGKREGGFDIAIANPPYVRQEKIKDQKPFLQKAGYEVYNSTSDLYTYFYEKSWQILKPDRFLTFISSNKWMRAKYGEKLRQFFRNKTRVMELIDFGGHKVFEATVDTNIILFQKTKPEEDYKMPFVNIGSEFDGENLEAYIQKRKQTIVQRKLSANGWTLADEKVLALKKKIERVGTPIKGWDVKIYRGITTGLNEVFIIDEDIKGRLIKQEPKSAEILRPILRGKDINKWYYTHKNYWLIYSYGGIDILKYPAVYDYLKGHKDKLEQVWEAKYGKKKWYELRGCDYYDEFEKEKIVWAEIYE